MPPRTQTRLPPLPDSIVAAAIQAAERRGESPSEVSLNEVALAAGISRSTLLRKLGGKRAVLDDAIAARGIELGRKPSVKERAIASAAALMSEIGIEAITLDAVAARAHCSVPSLYLIFGNRDGLLTAVFDRFGPLGNLEVLAAKMPESFEDRVRMIYRAFLTAFHREPRVLPALFADLLSRPDGPASRMLGERMPRARRSLELLLGGRKKLDEHELPFSTTIELLLGPLFFHALFTPRIWPNEGAEQLSAEDLAALFAGMFAKVIAPQRP
jgi:AcrR family transcriptional regulator